MLDPIPCPHCNYDLRGNTSSPCPECGFGFDDETLQTIERKRRFERVWLEASIQELWWIPCAILVIGAAVTINASLPPGPSFLRHFTLGRLFRAEGLYAWPLLLAIFIAGRAEHIETYARSSWRRRTRIAAALFTAIELTASLIALLT